MKTIKQTARDGTLRGGFAVLVRALILGAAGISGYLFYTSFSGGNAVGCAPGSSCDAALQSRWAYLFGIPVSGLALLVDSVLLLATFGCGASASDRQRRNAWEIILPSTILVLGAALWFSGVQAVILRQFCPWCMGAHALGAAAAVLLLTRLPLSLSDERREKEPAIPRGRAIKLAAAALAGVALAGVAQILLPRDTHTVRSITVPATSALIATNDGGAASGATAQAPRVLDVFGGMVRLDLSQTPLWGSPEAPHKLISLYDYTCHHCEIMHERVVEVFRAFSNRLAVVSLPMPLDSACNSLVTRTPAAHANACQYARIGLAVWRARRTAVEPFDDWFFEFFGRAKRPPSLNDTMEKARELVGFPVALDAVLRDPWIEEQLAANVAIYTISSRQFNNPEMPQFIIGTNIISGVLETTKLREIVGRYVSAP